MNFHLYHRLTFDLLYALAAIALFVIVERGVYLAYLVMRARRIGLDVGTEPAVEFKTSNISARDPISDSVRRYLSMGARDGVSRGQLEDYSSALYIEVDKKVSARLWVLDTIVTAAPLLGLLGTILGIMQTFMALAEGGVSDPAQVSRGIGMALTATAIGIGTALLGLLGHNVLNRMAHRLIEDFKFFVLRLTPPVQLS